jgi:oligopeptide transport system substrate-binding protein
MPEISRPVRLALRSLLLCLAGLLLSACTPRQTLVEQGLRTQTLHRGIGPAPSDLDPHLASSLTDIHVLSALFEGLLREDPDSLAPLPGVAERWEVSADGLVYTFHLRTDARWSDGRPIAASDFVASFRRALSPALGSPNAKLLYPVLNAEAWHRGRLDDFSAVGIHATDTHVLRVALEYPSAHFLSLLSHPVWFPVPLHAIAAAGPVDTRGNRWASDPATFVGNGPFRLREWRRGQVIVTEADPGHREGATLRLRAVHFHPFDSVEAAERAYRAGQVHVVDTLAPGRVETWRDNSPDQFRADPFLDTYFYRINTTRPFLGDVRVRRALSLGVDREQLVSALLRGGQRPATGFVPPGTGGYEPPVLVRHDPEAARALLAEAGHPEGRGLPVFDLLYNTSENHRRVAEVLQQQWRAIGVQTRLVNQEFATLLDARRTGDFQLLRSSWVADYNDPLSFLVLFTRDSAQNFTGWSDPAYDRDLYEATRTLDPARRQALYRAAEARLLEAAPIIPLYFNTHVYLLHPSVRGWRPGLLDRPPLSQVWLEASQ